MRILFQEELELRGLLLELAGLEAVAGSGDDMKASVLVETLCTSGVVEVDDIILVSLDDEDRLLELGDDVEGLHVVNLLEEAAAHLDVPESRDLGDVREAGVAGSPVVGDTESGEDEDEAADSVWHLGSSQGRDEASLTLADKDDAVWVDIGLSAEVVDDSTEVALLVEDRHIESIIV